MRFLLAIHNAYTDATSGAARSERTLMEWLAEAGHECQVLATARFDAQPPASFEEHLAELGVPIAWEHPAQGRPIGRFVLNGLPVTMLWTTRHAPDDADAAETGQYLGLLEGIFSTFRPQVVHTYGGQPLIREALVLAKQRGAIVATILHNYGYEHRFWFQPIDHVIVPSRYLAEHYAAAIGLRCTVMHPPIRWSEVEAPSNTREFLTFVNPSLHKGAALFARLALELGKKRPDIPVLVVQSASQGEALRQFPEVDLSKLRHIVAGPATQDPRDFLGLTKLMLVPSVFPEPAARVAMESLINGIPPLVSARGGLPEILSGAGRVLPMPTWLTPTTAKLPTPAEVEPWVEAVCELWDDAAMYELESRRARSAAERSFGEAESRERYLDFFTSLKPRRTMPVGPPARHPGLVSSIFQPRTPPGSAWPALPQAAVAAPWLLFQELERTQWLPAELIEKAQLTQVRVLLAHALQHVPYYRETLGKGGLRVEELRTLADFRRLPILPRIVYRQLQAEFRAETLPAGMQVTGTAKTSGTMGIPIEVAQTNETNRWWQALYLRDLAWCGIDPRGRLAVLRWFPVQGQQLEELLAGTVLPSWIAGLNEVIHMGPAHVLDIRQDPRRQLEWLIKTDPNYLLSKPSVLEPLAAMLKASGARLSSLRRIQTFSETLTDETRGRIEAGFGVPVYNLYSCNEAGYLASPCPEGHGLHVHVENVLFEVVDDLGQPCRPGQSGRVLLTTLHNFATPLIRYEILDRATVGPAFCPCGRGLPLLVQIDGKERPNFVLPSGQRRNTTPLIVELRKHPGFVQYQIIQETPRLVRLRLVPDPTWSDATRDALRATLHAFFEAPIDVEIELVDRLPMTGAGKIRTVACLVED